uniref:Uncharacterized protein n=1 Tax=Arundo donax TaxID=35708 RepID=A0A0A9E770_ARUDO
MLHHFNPHAPSFLFHQVSCTCMEERARSRRRKKRQEGKGRRGSSIKFSGAMPCPCPRVRAASAILPSGTEPKSPLVDLPLRPFILTRSCLFSSSLLSCTRWRRSLLLRKLRRSPLLCRRTLT